MVLTAHPHTYKQLTSLAILDNYSGLGPHHSVSILTFILLGLHVFWPPAKLTFKRKKSKE